MQGRLIITQIQLENFKSYAGKKTIGPFHTSFTAVVGPNGSGKSNLLECMLFAFGKRAKAMRLNKLSELIHKSKEYPSLSFATVEVYFENIIDSSLGYEKVPNSSIVLSRTIYINNTSIYKINNQEASYESVITLLKSRSIDLEHNRFLILQGEVEKIALMKPKSSDDTKVGLLEYLEEIIGTDVYIDKIKEIELELEEISEKVLIKKLQADQAAKSVESLIEPMKQALEYLEHYQKLLLNKNLKLQLHRKQNLGKLDHLAQEIKNIENEIQVIEEDFKNKKMIQLAANNEYELKISELKNLEKMEAVCIAQLNEIIKNDTELCENTKQIKNKIKSFTEDKNIEIKRLEDIENNIIEIDNKLPGINSHYLAIKTEKEEVEKEFEKIHSEISKISEKFYTKKENIEKELLPLKQESTKIKLDIESNKQKLMLYQSDKNNSKQESEKAENDLKQKKFELLHQIEEEKKLNKQSSDIEKEISLVQSEIFSKKENLSDVQKVIQKNKNILNDLNEEEKYKESASKQVREIISAKQNGRLSVFN